MLFLILKLLVIITAIIGLTAKSTKHVFAGKYSTNLHYRSSANPLQREEIRRIFLPIQRVLRNRKKELKDGTDNINIRIHQHRVLKRSLNTTEPSNTIRPKITTTAPPIFTVPPPTLICTGDESCQGRCTNHTEWRTESKFSCYCDPDCYEVFYDCCADYVKYCGVQEPKYVPAKAYNWSCESVGYYDSNVCEIGEGLWMVTRCPNDWSNDQIRTKCERPTNKVTLDSSDLSRYIPIVDSSNVTFRNFYCAMCNNASSPIDFWPVYVKTSVIPPRTYNISQKIHFLLLFDAQFPYSDGPTRPKITQARRYCVKNIIKKCSSANTDDSCSNGSTAIVSSLAKSYKNLDCALCQSSGLISLSCFPGLILAGCTVSTPQPFLLRLDYSKTFNNDEETCSFSVEKEPCGMRGTFYDHDLHVCLGALPKVSNASGYNRFLVYFWLRPDIQSKNILFARKDFQTSLDQLLGKTSILISNVSLSTISRQLSSPPRPAFILVSSVITLTPRQSLLVTQYKNAKNHKSDGNLINILFFNRPFNLIVNSTNNTVIKTTSRQMETLALPVCHEEKSCLGRCSQNRTEWRNDFKFVCYCDPDCYEVFNDCCSDYEKYCDTQTPKPVATQMYHWTCETIGHFSLKYCSVGDGIWMVSKCSQTWPSDKIRMKCEVPFRRLSLSSLDFERYFPVVSHDNITFRNAYCALCNGIKHYEPWALDIQASVIPPENYNITEKMRFLLRHGATPDSSWRPKPNQPRRYCLSEIMTSCPGNKSSHPCSNGPTTVVSVPRFANFKNIHCAICHGVPISSLSCFPTGLRKYCASFIPQMFSLVFSTKEEMTGNGKSRISVTRTVCGQKGLVYDYQLQICRVHRIASQKRNGQNRFYAVAWLQPQNKFRISKTLLNINFHKMLKNHFNVSDFQVVIINTTTIDVIALHVIECTIVFTPKQSLKSLSDQNDKCGNSLDKNLFEFLYFKKPFTLKLGNNSFTVVKTTSRPLACFGFKEYTSDQYNFLDDDSIYVTSTNTTYRKFEYFRENSQQLPVETMNITVCEKYKPAACTSTRTILTITNFTIFSNLSICRTNTSIMYHYGEYIVFANNSIAVCDTSIPNTAEKAVETIKDNEVFLWITVAGFILSMIFLCAIILFYKKFQHLRTPPSTNLLYFAFSLLIFQILWLLTSLKTIRDSSLLCTITAIIEHYSLLMSVTSLSVIAFDTCKLLTKNIPAPRPSEQKGKLCVHACIIWLLPAVLVGICLLLDIHGIVSVGYDETDICLLTEKNSHIYFVAIPIGILLLFNFLVYGKSVGHLSRPKQSNLWIHMVLSILIGFSWLFALLAIVAEPSKIFWYLFVIFISMPGVFVTSVFVLKVRNLKLYRNSSSLSIRNHYQSQSTMRVRNTEIPRSQTTAM